MNQNLTERVGRSQIGWYCLKHREGWFMGDAAGVICYKDRQLAKAALTIATYRESRYVFSIHILLERDLHPAGEHTPTRSLDKAMKMAGMKDW